MVIDPAVHERTVKMSHGHTRYFEAGSGEPCIFLHGVNYTAGGTNWIPMMSELGSDFRVIAPDFLGWGPGDRLEQGYSFAYLVDFVRELQDRLGITSSHIVGHSMGGWVASLFAYESPNRVNRLVLVGSGGLATRPLREMTEFRPPTREQLREEIKSRVIPSDREMLFELELQNVSSPNALPAYRRILSHMLNEETRQRYNTRRRLASISAPTLVIWGRHDQVNDIELGRETAGLIPDAKLVTFDCGHFVPTELPGEFAAALSEFLITSLMAQ